MKLCLIHDSLLQEEAQILQPIKSTTYSKGTGYLTFIIDEDKDKINTIAYVETGVCKIFISCTGKLLLVLQVSMAITWN